MNEEKSYKILLADDHALFLSGLQGLLARRPECEVVGTATNGEECLALMRERTHDVVLMDIDMPVMDGIRATEQAVTDNPDEKIITLSMHGDDEFYFRMVEAGAKGFILKSSDIDEVVTAIRTVCDGGTYFSQELLRNLVGNLKSTRGERPEEVLSEREKEILLLICRGMSRRSPTASSSPNGRWTSTAPTSWKRPVAATRPTSWSGPSRTVSQRCNASGGEPVVPSSVPAPSEIPHSGARSWRKAPPAAGYRPARHAPPPLPFPPPAIPLLAAHKKARRTSPGLDRNIMLPTAT